MKTIIIAFLVLCFTATVGNTNEKTNLNETINNWFVNQKQETIEFQKNNWAEAKEQNKYITDPTLIGMIDKLEFFVKELRKHIVRKL